MSRDVGWPKATDVCPNARRCAHAARSQIGTGGYCPDCGRQLHRRPARLDGGASNRGAVLYTQMAYHGAYEE